MSEKLFGIDVSMWQGDFDWAAAKKEGVEFGIVKCGGHDDGFYEDSKFLYNCRESSAVGMKIGAYYFGNAATVAEAKEEAAHCISILKGHAFSYPIYYDVEASRMNVGKANLDAIITTFCDALVKAGYLPGFYMSYNWYRNYCNGAELAKKYTAWIASWGSVRPCECDMWQFGGETNLLRSNKVTGKVVDQNYCYRDFPSEVRAKGLNGFKKANEIICQSYFKGKWGLEIKSGTGSYSGLFGNAISGFRAKYKNGKVVHSQSHLLGGEWLGDMTRYVKDGGSGTGYSGIMGKPIDAIRLWGDEPFEYRAHVKDGGWCAWIKSTDHDKGGYSSYAGIIGKTLDGIQIR